MRGRAVLALTYAGEALRQTAERYRDLQRPETERLLNTHQSLPQSVFSSVVQPLRGALEEPFVDALDPNDLGAWPPFVLLENRHVDPALEIPAAEIPSARTAIVAALDIPALPDDAPFAWRVAHFFARSWVEDVARVRAADPEDRRRFLTWMVDVALAVANPEDRGHELLTRLMLHLAHRGELRKVRSRELVALAEAAASAVTDLHERLTREPRADRQALDAMEDLVRRLREKLPRQGVVLPFPATVRQAALKPFQHPAVTWDGLVAEGARSACAAVGAAARDPDLAGQLRPVLERMLEADRPTQKLRSREERFLGDEPSNAVHCAHFLLARLAAAVDWLLHTTDAEREDYAARTLGIDPRRSEAYRRLRRVVGELSLPDGLDDGIAVLRARCNALVAELDAGCAPC
jgi:hypothetical protein